MRRSDLAMTSEMVSQLRGYLVRIADIEFELKKLRAEKKRLYEEARACGFDKGAMHRAVQRKLIEMPQVEHTGLNEEKAAIYEAVLSDE